MADVVGLIGALNHVHPKAHQVSLIADMVIEMQIGQQRNATLRDGPLGLPQGERSPVGSSPEYSRMGVTPSPEAFSSPLLGEVGWGRAAGTLPPRAPPYKGAEQEELPRTSVQRRGSRRGVREYNRLGEGGGEVGAAHEEASQAGTRTRQVGTTSQRDSSTDDRFMMSCPWRE